jgi:hypothetical protein
VVANSRVAGRLEPLEAVRPRIGATVGLLSIVAGSALVRVLAAIRHAAPGYFPDEYIYTSISRSIAEHGRPLVRGGPAHFPALLEPIVAAPFWRIFSVETAYHLIQAENAIFMALAAFPVYGLARRLRFGTGYALGCAAFAVAVPDASYGGYILADPLAYLLALSALYVGVVALERPRAGVQLAFIALAGAASFARVQYVVLAPAYVIAACVLDRRRALRTQRLPIAVFAAAGAAVVLVGAGRIAGYYSVMGIAVGTGLLKWLALELFFLTLAGGVVLGPGAVVGVLRGREREERAFSALVIPFALAVLVEGALYASNNEIPRFKERYLMTLLPLLPLAFGVYLRRNRPWKLPVTVAAAAIAGAAALMPLSGYAAGTGFDDSPFFWSFITAQWQFGIPNAALIYAAYATLGAVLIVAVAWGRLGRAALGVALAAAVALSVGATRFDFLFASQINGHLVAKNQSWVDNAHVGPVAAIETNQAPSGPMTMQLFWNPSIKTELLLGQDAVATDAFATKRIAIGSDGVPRVNGRRLHTAILFQDFETTPVWEGVVQVAKVGSFSLLRPVGTPRFRLLEDGRYGDGWLSVNGTLRVWPGPAGSGVVSFTLSLPRSAPEPVRIRFGRSTLEVPPGGSRLVRLRVDAAPATQWSTRFTLVSGGSANNNRPVSVRSTVPLFRAG